MKRWVLPSVFLAFGLTLSVVAQQARPVGAPVGKAAAPGKAAKKKATVEAPVAGLESTLGLRFEALRPLRSVPDDEITLPNGLRLAVSENREIPQVSVFAIIPGGTASDPAGRRCPRNS